MVSTKRRQQQPSQSPISITSSITSSNLAYNNDKAIINVGTCVVFGWWIHASFLKPLHNDAIDMHQRQMDPTEIVQVPYDLRRLSWFVFNSCIASIFYWFLQLYYSTTISSTQQSYVLVRLLQEQFMDVFLMSLFFFLSYLLCGTSISTMKIYHTILASLYISFVSCNGISTTNNNRIRIGTNTSFLSSSLDRIVDRFFPFDDKHCNSDNDNDFIADDDIHNRVSIPQPEKQQCADTAWSTNSNTSRTKRESKLNVPPMLHIMLCIVIVFQILLLYDHGLQIQRWPVPIILGTSIGWIVATIVHLLFGYISHSSC